MAEIRIERRVAAPRLARERIVGLLAPALGTQKSEEMVSWAAMELGCPRDGFELEQASRVLELLGQQSGIVGVAARFARTRLLASHAQIPSVPPEHVTLRAPPIADAPPSRPVVVADIVALLAPVIGTEKSAQHVATVIGALGLDPNALTADDALKIFDTSANASGIIGAAARFAKAHFILKYPQPQAR